MKGLWVCIFCCWWEAWWIGSGKNITLALPLLVGGVGFVATRTMALWNKAREAETL